MRIRPRGLPRENEHALALTAGLFEVPDDAGDRVPRSRSRLRHLTAGPRPGRRA